MAVGFLSPVPAITGLTLIKTQTFSGVASQAIGSAADPIFNSTFDVYRITVSFTANPTADGVLYMKMRANTTDSSTDYNFAYNSIIIGGATGSVNTANATTGFHLATYDSGTSAYNLSVSFDLYNPFIASHTSGVLGALTRTSTGQGICYSGGFVHLVSTSYNAINLIASAGNITGTCSIYGYEK